MDSRVPTREILSANYVSPVQVPKLLTKSFDEVLKSKLLAKSQSTAEGDSKHQIFSIDETEKFFKSLNSSKGMPIVNKHLLQAQKRNSFLFNSSGSNSGTAGAGGANLGKFDEFPIGELVADVRLLNAETAKVHEVVDQIERDRKEGQNFNETMSELSQALERWNEKTEILARKCGQKSKVVVSREPIVDQTVTRDLKGAKLLVENLAARKNAEITFGEHILQKETNLEPIERIGSLVNSLINREYPL